MEEEGSSGTHCLRSISKSEVLASSTMKLAACFIQVPYKGSRYSKKKLECKGRVMAYFRPRH